MTLITEKMQSVLFEKFIYQHIFFDWFGFFPFSVDSFIDQKYIKTVLNTVYLKWIETDLIDYRNMPHIGSTKILDHINLFRWYL